MKSPRLTNLTIDALLELRERVDNALSAAGKALQAQLARIGVGTAAKRGSSAMRGRKVAPKYRGPRGETWAGRGVRPRWLTALLKQGHKVEEFSVDNKTATAKVRKGPVKSGQSSKKGRRRRRKSAKGKAGQGSE
jgi:DNA-binding protein H-NS